MASGYKSLHPVTEDLLKVIGIPSKNVTQGYGSATASASFHEEEGYAGHNRKYSSCFDLKWPISEENRNALIDASVCVFPRNWPGNKHIHCVHIGLVDKDGKCRIRSGPRTQILDFIAGKNGLVGHDFMRREYGVTSLQATILMKSYKDWIYDKPIPIYLLYKSNNKGFVACASWLEGSTTTCEIRRLIEALDGRIITSSTKEIIIRTKNGVWVKIKDGLYLSGEFLRGPVRSVTSALGLDLIFYNDTIANGPEIIIPVGDTDE